MRLLFYLEHGEDRVTSLTVADAIIRECEDDPEHLNPVIIAKAILLQAESEDTEEGK